MDTTKERLRKKLNKKKKKDSPGTQDATPGTVDEDSLFTMLNQVNKMLKTNPEMVKKVSKCVNSIFENKDLMSSLVSEIESNVTGNTGNSTNNTQNHVDQTLVNNTDGVLTEATGNESIQ